jgi:pyrroloquinoline quinone (PQQ) biosynthesis protein C
MLRAGLANRWPKLRCPTIRTFHRSPATRDYHFDTHQFVRRLEKEGLTRAQSEGVMAAMADVIDESIKNMAANMVTRADQEKVRLC